MAVVHYNFVMKLRVLPCIFLSQNTRFQRNHFEICHCIKVQNKLYKTQKLAYINFTLKPVFKMKGALIFPISSFYTSGTVIFIFH